MSVTIDHTFEWPVGQWRGKGDWNLLATPAVRNIVTDTTHSERKITSIYLLGHHNRLDITSASTHGMATHIVHGICVDPDQIYGEPYVAGESYDFAVTVASGSEIDDVWTVHNIATGHIRITTTGVTDASEQDKITQHNHPHTHLEFRRAFNNVYARLTALEAHHPAPPSGSSDSDSDDSDDSSDESSSDTGNPPPSNGG